MRLISSLFIISVFAFSCEQNGPSDKKETNPKTDTSAISASVIPADTANLPKFSFQESEFDFGQIKEGDVVKHTFKFTNTGKTNLVISDARGSCGCTIPSYPKEPIAPGAEGTIDVQFNSKNKTGVNQKFVSIVANTYPEVSSISIKATVEAKDASTGPLAH
ncbi:MAG: DUF1573 domain-containing protein [Opitutaceae bacterium]|nr:DUF1573 domain-containing protein [Cytophagales bacterium]